MEEKKRQLRLNADLSGLDNVFVFLEEHLAQGDCPTNIVTQICIAVEEVFVNIVHYAYQNSGGECRFDLCVCPGKMTLAISDSGEEFNPLEKEDPDITLPAQDRSIGGLGIWMVKQSMDLVEYRYKDGQNQLTLVKSWK